MINFNSSIRNCLMLTDDIDLLFQAGPMVPLEASHEFKKTSLRSYKYKEIYDVAIQNQDYNLMLNDQSIFQFSKIDDGNFRLAYYPNPYSFYEYNSEKKDALEMLNDGQLSMDEYEQLLSEIDSYCDIPIIRYDYSLNQYNEMYHPAAHLHIGFQAENRWPVRKVLSPYAFLLKILAHYYPEKWFEVNESPSNYGWLDEKYRNEVARCPNINSTHFSDKELSRLHFT